jgi:hypothetical protein
MLPDILTYAAAQIVGTGQIAKRTHKEVVCRAHQRIALCAGKGSGERQQRGPGAEQIAERAVMQNKELVRLRAFT